MHGLKWMEFAPALPLLPELGAWCTFVFVLGCLAVVDAFVTAVLSALAGFTVHIPFIGDPTSAAIHKAEQAVSHALGTAESYIDARIGAAEHQMARTVDWLGREIRGHASLLWTLTTLLGGSATTYELQQLLRGLRAAVHAASGTATHALHHSIATGKQIRHGIGEDVLPRIRTAEREIGRVIGHDLPAIRAREGRLEHGAVDTWKWIRTHPLSAGAAAFTGAVAIALGRLGLGWARCAPWKKIGHQVCHTPIGEIEGVLGLLAAGAVIADFRELVKLAQSVEHGVATVLQDVAKA